MRHLIFFLSISLMLMGCSKEKPETPRGLAQTDCDLYSITFEWDASEDAENYSLYRSADGIADFESIYDGPKTSATDTDLSYATTYYYKVSAKNKVGESTPSLTVTGSTAIPDGFEVTGSPYGNIDETFNYVEEYNGKPSYHTDYGILRIITMSSGEWEDHWVIYDNIDSNVLYYHPDITDYPSPTGWLKRYDDSETDIVLSPI